MPILEYDHPVSVQVGQPVLIPLYSSVRAGFLSPADDFLFKRIDLSEELIRHPEATFLMRIRGHSMAMAGIDDGEFTCKRLYSMIGVTRLQAANPEYEDIVFKEGQTLKIWGVVTSCIKQF